MTDQANFERALERRLVVRATRADRPFDATVVARAAIEAAPRRPGLFGGSIRVLPAVGWLILVGLLALVGAVAIGGVHAPPRPDLIVVAVGQHDGLRIQANGRDALHIGDGPYFQPRWSHDGELVAATALTDRDANHLLVYRSDGSYVTDRVGVTGEIEWSPTGHQIAIQSISSNDIGVLSVGEGTVILPMMPDDLDFAAGFSWSPDGRRIVVASRAAEDGTLGPAWILDATGRLPAARFGTEDASGLREPRWSPDGTRIASVERCPNGDCIRIRDAASGQRRSEIMALASPSRLDWSPDGAWLAFDSDGDLFIASSDVATVTPLTSGRSVDRFVEWAPDGQSVVVWRTVTEGGQEPYEFWSVPIDGSAPTLLARDAFGVSIRPTDPSVARPAATASPLTMADASDCPVTKPGKAPGDIEDRLFGSASAFGNNDLWVGGLGEEGVILADSRFVESDGSIGMKFGWWRIESGTLTIAGRRLDASGPPLRASVPDGYGSQGFQASGISFPTEGCWEVTGAVGGSELTFVIFLLRT
jgi:Tol biopolymer transport system component